MVKGDVVRQTNLFLQAVLLLGACTVASGEEVSVRVFSEATINSSIDGMHDGYEIQADPEDANNLIVCGMRWDSKDNASYGFLYSSQDGGKTWSMVLEDKHTTWVSEESCAFGVHGVAYFVAAASKVDDAGTHHGQGTTRIYVSRDAGRTWTLGIETGWTDFSASVVDRDPGPDQNRLYVFFNDPSLFYLSVGNQAALDKLPKVGQDAGSSIGLISYRDGDTAVSGPFFNPQMYRLLLHGSFPGQNLILKDRSLLTLFWSKKRVFDEEHKRDKVQFIFASQHTDRNRKTLSEPVTVYSFYSDESKCDSYLSAPAVYDPSTNTIYLTYLDGPKDRCMLMLATSSDDGKSWSAHPWTERIVPGSEVVKARDTDYQSLDLARNRDGVMALSWHDASTSCWYISVSTDNGQSYSHPEQLSCSPDGDGKYRINNAYLGLKIDQAKPDVFAQFRVDNSIYIASSHVSGMSASTDGAFLPV